MYLFGDFFCKSNFFDLEENLNKKFLGLEKKVMKDLLYKRVINLLYFDSKSINLIYIDKESKILGYKKNCYCTQQRLFLTFSKDKKFLKSTVFGAIKFVND